MLRSRPAFSLIELLLVIGILAILAAIVLVAMNPKPMVDERNTKRTKDVQMLLDSVTQYTVANKGIFPEGITFTAKEICRSSELPCHNGVDLDVLTGSYLPELPVDPLASASGTGSHYTIMKDRQNRITIAAPDAEGGAKISVTH
ncbi:type II secretion system protein [Candidatus Peregrinibacteria bacterium]|nr:type II secretion system protein [Candidatus Peregrinibacteria bacterium]